MRFLNEIETQLAAAINVKEPLTETIIDLNPSCQN